MAGSADVLEEEPHGTSLTSLVRSTLALHANTLMTSILGFGFVVLAARLYEQDQLGRDMALVSAMTLLAAMAEANAGMALLRFLPRMGMRSIRAVARTFAITSAIALVLSLAFVLIAPRVSDGLSYIDDVQGLAAMFVCAVIAWNCFVVADSALTAVRAASWVPVKNVVFGVVKLAVMVAFAHSTFEHGVFYAWALPVLVLVVPTVILTFRIPLRRHAQMASDDQVEEVVAKRRSLLRYLGFDYLASILSQIGTSALPLVVIVTLGSTANAEFAVAFAIVMAIEQFALNASIALTVEGAFDERSFARLVRHSFIRFNGLLTVAVLIGIAAAPLAAMAFGEDYGDSTTTVLRLLLLGLIPEAVAVLYESVLRVRAQGGRIAAVAAAQATITLTLAAVLSGPLGLAGVGWAWVIGHTIVAIVILPSMLRLMFPRSAPEPS
jgi:O-antigen/teichoic acid export membrane protein